MLIFRKSNHIVTASGIVTLRKQVFSAPFLVLLESCLQTCTTHTIAECAVNKLLMMGRRTVRNM